MKGLRQYVLIAAAALSFILMPCAADAASLTCNNGSVSSGYLYNTQSGSGACEFTGMQHIFSQVVCDFVSVLNSVMGGLYCGIQYSIINLLRAIITLYVCFFGIQLMMGTTQLRAKEAVMRLIKIAIVWTFASQSSWGIGYVFNFFMSAIGDMVQWVLQIINPNIGASGGDVMPLYSYLDDILYSAITGPFTTAKSKVIGFFCAMVAVEPPLVMIALYWLLMSFKIMVNALISFLLGVSALAFLIALSPIFLSMMLFQATYHFFESWVRYMISFSLQIVVVFAAVALWLAVMNVFVGFFNELSDLIWVYQKVWVQSADTYAPTDTFALCPVTISPGAYGPIASCPGGFDPTNNPSDADQLIPPSEIMKLVNGSQNQDFLYYLAYNIGSLVLIAYAFSILLQHAPQIAKELVGPAQVPTLGGGWGNNMGFGAPRGGAMGSPFGWGESQRQRSLSKTIFNRSSDSPSSVFTDRSANQVGDRNQRTIG